MSTGDPLGVDIYWPNAFPLKMRLSWGTENLQAALTRRLLADDGCLATINDNPDYGGGLWARLNGKTDPATLSAINGEVVAEVLKDPRVRSAEAHVVAGGFGSSTGQQTAQIAIRGMCTTGPFAFVIPIDQISQAMLNRGLAGAAPVGSAAVFEPVTIVTQTGPPGANGAPGPGGGAGTGGAASLVPELDGFYASDTAAETFMDGDQVDFNRLAANTVTIAFSFLAEMPSGGTGTVRFRVGGTQGQTNGTLVATATVTSSGSYETISNAAAFAKPTGLQQVKLTMETSAGGLDCLVKQVNVSIF